MLEEIQPGKCICSGKVQQTHTHTHTHTHTDTRMQPECPSAHAQLPLDGQSACSRTQNKRGCAEGMSGRGYNEAICSVSRPSTPLPTVPPRLKTTQWRQKKGLVRTRVRNPAANLEGESFPVIHQFLSVSSNHSHKHSATHFCDGSSHGNWTHEAVLPLSKW